MMENLQNAISFREFLPKDAKALVDCIREEYGEEYFRREYYNPKFLIAEHQQGNNVFLVAEKDGEVVGMLGQKRVGRVCELSTGIVRKKARGCGIMQKLFRRAVERIEGMEGVVAASCHAVAYHDITQKRLEELGFVPTAVLLSEFLEGCHSYQKDRNVKHPHILLIKDLRHEKSVLHLPAVLQKAAETVYQELQRPFVLAREVQPLHPKTALRIVQDERQASCTIFVQRAGEDIAVQIERLREKYSGKLQTFHVFLSMEYPETVPAYERLIAMGFFFTGFCPACYRADYLVLHDPRNVRTYADSFVVTPRAKKLLDWIDFLRDCDEKTTI